MSDAAFTESMTDENLPAAATSAAEDAMRGLDALTGAVNAARDRAQSQQAEMERLRSELSGLRGELEAARERAEQTGKLEVELETMKLMLNEAGEKMQQMETEANERSKLLREQRTQLKKLHEANKMMQAQSQKMRNEFARIMQQKGLGGSLRSMFGG